MVELEIRYLGLPPFQPRGREYTNIWLQLYRSYYESLFLQNSPPQSALNNDVFRLVMFLDTEAPRIYQNADQLELHLNTIFITAHDICFTELLYLHMGSIYEQLKGLSNEPMVFCYGDIHPGNFIINDDGHITIIDFSETSILPSSFARYAIVSTSKLSRG